ncbi:hypothetical protein WJX73_001057 [Symbiochloris irregularis]|uniref:Uncharacterized protein n=1 Tax=Symbiochloris irregularis TaxID=706552 RepID=A0AAW1NKZ1_9CHLO
MGQAQPQRQETATKTRYLPGEMVLRRGYLIPTAAAGPIAEHKQDRPRRSRGFGGRRACRGPAPCDLTVVPVGVQRGGNDHERDECLWQERRSLARARQGTGLESKTGTSTGLPSVARGRRRANDALPTSHDARPKGMAPCNGGSEWALISVLKMPFPDSGDGAGLTSLVRGGRIGPRPIRPAAKRMEGAPQTCGRGGAGQSPKGNRMEEEGPSPTSLLLANTTPAVWPSEMTAPPTNRPTREWPRTVVSPGVEGPRMGKAPGPVPRQKNGGCQGPDGAMERRVSSAVLIVGATPIDILARVHRAPVAFGHSGVWKQAGPALECIALAAGQGSMVEGPGPGVRGVGHLALRPRARRGGRVGGGGVSGDRGAGTLGESGAGSRGVGAGGGGGDEWDARRKVPAANGGSTARLPARVDAYTRWSKCRLRSRDGGGGALAQRVRWKVTKAMGRLRSSRSGRIPRLRFKDIAVLHMSYKFLNTIIDDLFAFVIKMPTLHRLSVFRDDLVFLVYIYQRWIYRVDRKRANEFGYSAEQPIEETSAIIRDQAARNQALPSGPGMAESGVAVDAVKAAAADASAVKEAVAGKVEELGSEAQEALRRRRGGDAAGVKEAEGATSKKAA